jgi:predicted deacetylase
VTARLVVSISGLGGSPLDASANMAAELDRRGVPLSVLTTPKRLAEAPAVTDWLRARTELGDALLMHGFDTCGGGRAHHGWRLLGTAMLPAHETRLRLIAVRGALAQLDLAAAGFCSTGAAVPAATLEVMRDSGFRVCAEPGGVRDLGSGGFVSGRVIGSDFGLGPWATGAQPWRARALVLTAARAARLGRLVRLRVSAADLEWPGMVQAVLDAVDIALHHGATGATYATLVAPVVPAPRTRHTVRTTVRPSADPVDAVDQTAQTSVSSPVGTTVTDVPTGASCSSQK